MFSTHRIAITILLLLFASSFNARHLNAQIVNRWDLKTIDVHGAREWERVVQIGKGIQLKAKIEVSTKGNGGLEIGNLYLKVYDGHDDMARYDNGLMHIDLTDLNDDGYRDLVISGLVLYSYYKGDHIIGKENVVFIYMFDPKKKRFKRSYKKASFDLTEGRSGVPKRILQDWEQKLKRLKKKQELHPPGSESRSMICDTD